MFIVILGGSRPQFSAVEACHELGYDFIVFDGNKDCFATKYVTKEQFKQINIMDKEQVLNAINHLPFRIDACVSTQTDVAIEAQAYVNKALKLTGINPNQVSIVLDKYEMSLACKKAKVTHPKTIIFESIDQILREFKNMKIVIKPTDSSGSKGVYILDLASNKFQEKLAQFIKDSVSFSPSKQIIIQEFIDGVEVGAQYFHLNNEESLFIMHDDQLGGPYKNIPIGHSMPCNLDDIYIQDCKSSIENFIFTNALPEGPYNVDFIVKDNKIYLIEIGARVGATCLQELTYEYLGFNLIKEQIKLITGFQVSRNFKKKRLPVVSRMIFSEKKGIFKSISIPDLEKIEKEMHVSFREFKIDTKIGENLNGFNSGRDRLGYMVVSSESIKNASNAINKAYYGIKIN